MSWSIYSRGTSVELPGTCAAETEARVHAGRVCHHRRVRPGHQGFFASLPSRTGHVCNTVLPYTFDPSPLESIPYTLSPTPCSQYPMPFTLCHIPCTLYPLPFRRCEDSSGHCHHEQVTSVEQFRLSTLYLSPFTLYSMLYPLSPITYTLYAMPCTLYPVPYSLFSIPFTLYHIPYTLYPGPGLLNL